MPIYDYRCQDCGQIIEVLHGVDASGPATCDACGGQLRKMLSLPSIVFKGSGWAKTDARPAAKPAAGGDGTDASAPSAAAKTTDPKAPSESPSTSGPPKAASGTD
jgi:putative FmdB family regulatory protein